MLLQFLGLLLASFTTAQTVNVKSGTINGAKCPYTNVNSFLGIPFAVPPVNALRFAPPQAYNATYPSGTLDATAEPNICYQFISEFQAPGTQSEDCLYLNVYAPATATPNASLPVKFWIYGGAFAAGGITDQLYSGCSIATDSIVVLAAYRLGPLGFLYDPGAGIGGNMAIQDLETALQWVQSNIASFGGNPEKVVVFGQSAGATSTWILSTLPSAPSLMNAAIAESGAGIPLATKDSAGNFSNTFISNLGCNSSDINCLRNASTQALLKASPPIPALEIAVSGKRFGPLVDGSIIPAEPNTVGSKVPLIAGTTTQEGTLFAILQDANIADWQPQNYTTYLSEVFGKYASTISSLYPLSLFNSTAFPSFYATANIITQITFFCPSQLALAATTAAGQPVWTYRWAHTPSCIWIPGFGSDTPLIAQVLALLGPTHTSEIPFVFNETAHLPEPSGSCSLTAQEDAIAGYLASAWTGMAESQSPGGGWPAWNATTSTGLYILNETAFGYVNFTQCAVLNQVLAGLENGSATAAQSTSTATATSASATAKSGAGKLSGNMLLAMLGAAAFL